jgi:hypothetical protein
VCLTLLPALVVLLLHFFLPNAALRQLTLGLAGGAAFLGLAFDWMLTSEKKAGLRTLGALSSVLCLSQTIWLVALSVHMP